MTKPMDLIAVVVMLVLCLSWALQQIAIKIALPEIGPLAQGSVRYAGASALIALYLLTRSKSFSWMSGLTFPGLVVGVMFGAEFILLFFALTYTDATRAVMFLYTAPFIVAVGSHFLFTGERLDAKSAIGVLLAFAGVVVSLDPTANLGGDTLKGDLMALGAGALWGLTTLLIKGSQLRYGPATQILLYQLGVAAVMFSIGCLIEGDNPFVPMSGLTMAAMVYQTAWVATITFGIWFYLITTYSATSLSVITFVTPIIGAILGYLLLHEPLGPRHVVAVLAVAGGILLVT